MDSLKTITEKNHAFVSPTKNPIEFEEIVINKAKNQLDEIPDLTEVAAARSGIDECSVRIDLNLRFIESLIEKDIGICAEIETEVIQSIWCKIFGMLPENLTKGLLPEGNVSLFISAKPKEQRMSFISTEAEISQKRVKKTSPEILYHMRVMIMYHVYKLYLQSETEKLKYTYCVTFGEVFGNNYNELIIIVQTVEEQLLLELINTTLEEIKGEEEYEAIDRWKCFKSLRIVLFQYPLAIVEKIMMIEAQSNIPNPPNIEKARELYQIAYLGLDEVELRFVRLIKMKFDAKKKDHWDEEEEETIDSCKVMNELKESAPEKTKEFSRGRELYDRFKEGLANGEYLTPGDIEKEMRTMSEHKETFVKKMEIRYSFEKKYEEFNKLKENRDFDKAVRRKEKRIERKFAKLRASILTEDEYLYALTVQMENLARREAGEEQESEEKGSSSEMKKPVVGKSSSLMRRMKKRIVAKQKKLKSLDSVEGCTFFGSSMRAKAFHLSELEKNDTSDDEPGPSKKIVAKKLDRQLRYHMKPGKAPYAGLRKTDKDMRKTEIITATIKKEGYLELPSKKKTATIILPRSDLYRFNQPATKTSKK